MAQRTPRVFSIYLLREHSGARVLKARLPREMWTVKARSRKFQKGTGNLVSSHS